MNEIDGKWESTKLSRLNLIFEPCLECGNLITDYPIRKALCYLYTGRLIIICAYSECAYIQKPLLRGSSQAVVGSWGGPACTGLRCLLPDMQSWAWVKYTWEASSQGPWDLFFGPSPSPLPAPIPFCHVSLQLSLLEVESPFHPWYWAQPCHLSWLMKN